MILDTIIKFNELMIQKYDRHFRFDLVVEATGR